MWLISVGPKKLIISDHILDKSKIQGVICDNVAQTYSQLGYAVYRVPAENDGFNGVNGDHYTYTNAVIVNQIVLVPTFSNAKSGWNSQAFQVFGCCLLFFYLYIYKKARQKPCPFSLSLSLSSRPCRSGVVSSHGPKL